MARAANYHHQLLQQLHQKALESIRGVQYVHCVMHKRIMFTLGGKRKTSKVRKKHVNLTKSGGKFQNNNFPKTEGKCSVLQK